MNKLKLKITGLENTLPSAYHANPFTIEILAIGWTLNQFLGIKTLRKSMQIM